MSFGRFIPQDPHQRQAERNARNAAVAEEVRRAKKPSITMGGRTSGVAIDKEDAIESEPYRRLVANLPCARCFVHGFSQAAHPPPTGKGIKEDDRECFPLCCNGPRGYKGCHPKFDNYQLVPKEKMRAQAMKWGKHTRATIAAAGDWPKGLPPYDANKAARLAANAAHKRTKRKVKKP